MIVKESKLYGNKIILQYFTFKKGLSYRASTAVTLNDQKVLEKVIV